MSNFFRDKLAGMATREAIGVTGVVLEQVKADGTEEKVFRVHHAKQPPERGFPVDGAYTDYRITHHDVAVTINDPSAVFYDGATEDGRCGGYLDYQRGRARVRTDSPVKVPIKQLFICRGLPWCGKSYRARQILEEYGGDDPGAIFSTDEYFYKVANPGSPGEYSFDQRQLGRAHEWNVERACLAMSQGVTPVVVDNTNTMRWEYEGYAAHGRKCGYEVSVVEPTCERWVEIRGLLSDRKANKTRLVEWARLLSEGSVESHSVPAPVIEKMMWRWED